MNPLFPSNNFQMHPMKGPMTTQTLRGLAHAGAMHWRGDRANGVFGIDATDENLSFNNFQVNIFLHFFLHTSFQDKQ